MRASKNYSRIIIIFLIVASCIAFGRIADNDFINYDDVDYIIGNNDIQSGINLQSIKWAFTAFKSYWQPLSWISLMADWGLFGINASGHHLVSLLLHIGSVIFLFLFLNKTTQSIWSAAFAAALFALHPLRVESVAWAAERKDVLSMFFGMACIYAYSFYSESSKLSKYLLCLILFSMALMSKPMMVTLPFVLMLLDHWPLQRWQQAINEPGRRFNLVGKLVWEKIPFVCLSIFISIITFIAQAKQGAVTPLELLSFLDRVAHAIISYVTYLIKIFCPVNLAIFYPYEFYLTLWKVIVSGAFIIVITIIVLYYIRKLPFLFVGWFWYLGTLVPIIGLMQAGEQAMADRFTYLPSIGIVIMLSWGLPLLFKRNDMYKRILFTAAIFLIIIISLLTWKQCGYWKNSIVVWNHALQVTKDNDTAHINLGLLLSAEGKIDEAIDHYSEAIRIRPDYYMTYFNRGNAYASSSRYQLAIKDYSETIEIYPDYTDAYHNRAAVYLKLGNDELGCPDAQKACALGNCKLLKLAQNTGLCR